jgi:hypothetical protein
MADDSNVIVASLTRSLEDTDDETTATQRDKARSQVLWMIGQARRAAKNGRVDDVRWWRDRATCALWNMN